MKENLLKYKLLINQMQESQVKADHRSHKKINMSNDMYNLDQIK